MVENMIYQSHAETSASKEERVLPTYSAEVMTVKQASVFLGLSASTLYTYVSKRRIPYSKRNGALFFLRESLLSWIKEAEKPTFSQLIKR
ncbi:helix-turn-helix domain-containing protein [Dyadobacter sp. CY312]|uniref:helix-turn-helix domain-containing protein n=1 Tax=Dyadobacter sp. CY312 TaxID=2907303 RepID=UPI0038D3A472